jgi:hypothetical protein
MMLKTESTKTERPDRNNVKIGGLVFVIDSFGKIISGEVNSIRPFEIGVRYIDSFGWVVSEVVPYSKVAFPGVYGGFVMGEDIKKRIFPEAA